MMKIVKAKRARAEVAQKSRENGERVEKIFREAEKVEDEVQEICQRFTQRLKRHRAALADRANADATAAEADDRSEGGE